MSDNEPNPTPMKDRVQEYLEEIEASAITLDEFDSAICGIVEINDEHHVVYNRRKCIEALMSQGMEADEAEEYFCFNTERAIPYMQSHGAAPMIMNDLEDY